MTPQERQLILDGMTPEFRLALKRRVDFYSRKRARREEKFEAARTRAEKREAAYRAKLDRNARWAKRNRAKVNANWRAWYARQKVAA